MTDEDIMIKVKEGNVAMLAILFERYHMKLFNFFLRLTGAGNLSEDLTQEVFFRILKYRKTFRGESKFTTWMFQVGRNVHIDYLRKHKKAAEMSLEDAWEEKADTGPGPDERSESEQESLYLHQALSLLSPAKKEVLVLSRFQGMKYKDISRVLGCSLAAVKTQVHRAIKDLRKNYLELKGGVG